MKLFFVLFMLFFLFIPRISYGTKKTTSSIRQHNQNIEKELKIRGQFRTISMMLVIKNKKEVIDFINIRQDFKNEIIKTEY